MQSNPNQRRHETPLKRVNPSGKAVWVARYTDRLGKRKSTGTFELKRDAQSAIDAAYEHQSTRPLRIDTLGGYASTWTARHPRSERTNTENTWRIGVVLGIEIDGVPLRHWPLSDIRRRHALQVQDTLLREHGRSAEGATGILRALSALTNDAIDDELADTNPWLRLGVRATDPRVTKARRVVRTFSWQDMHAFAAAAGPHEAMVRVLADGGLRLGELLALERRDLSDGVLRVARTAHEGRILDGTKNDHGQANAGRDVPVPPALAAMLRSLAPRIDTPLLFPTPSGRVWRERNFRRDVWQPARKRTGMDIRPHEMRHSYVSLMRAAGVDPADLAEITGHSVETLHGHYTHALRRSFDRVRDAVG